MAQWWRVFDWGHQWSRSTTWAAPQSSACWLLFTGAGRTEMVLREEESEREIEEREMTEGWGRLFVHVAGRERV